MGKKTIQGLFLYTPPLDTARPQCVVKSEFWMGIGQEAMKEKGSKTNLLEKPAKFKCDPPCVGWSAEAKAITAEETWIVVEANCEKQIIHTNVMSAAQIVRQAKPVFG